MLKDTEVQDEAWVEVHVSVKALAKEMVAEAHVLDKVLAREIVRVHLMVRAILVTGIILEGTITATVDTLAGVILTSLSGAIFIGDCHHMPCGFTSTGTIIITPMAFTTSRMMTNMKLCLHQWAIK